jgi:hypothetical protein
MYPLAFQPGVLQEPGDRNTYLELATTNEFFPPCVGCSSALDSYL